MDDVLTVPDDLAERLRSAAAAVGTRAEALLRTSLETMLPLLTGERRPPLTLPDDLTAELSVLAQKRGEDLNAFVARTLRRVVEVLGEGGSRTGWWLSILQLKDEDACERVGLGKVLAAEYPRWRAVPLSAEKAAPDKIGGTAEPEQVVGEEKGGGRPEPTPGDDPAEDGGESERRAELCVLTRDDGATAIMEFLPDRNEAWLLASAAGKCATKRVRLQNLDSWVDHSADGWRTIMRALDETADELAAGEDKDSRPDEVDADPRSDDGSSGS